MDSRQFPNSHPRVGRVLASAGGSRCALGDIHGPGFGIVSFLFMTQEFRQEDLPEPRDGGDA
jgi:hypothetical protein